MKTVRILSIASSAVVLFLVFGLVAHAQIAKRYGLTTRTPWKTAHVTGAPEPPPPYKIVRAFPKLTFTNPLHLTTAPGINRFFVCEQAGKIYSFPIDSNAAKADPVLDVKDLPSKVRTGDLYALAFHPQFAKNRYCYVCYIAERREKNADGSRISRFRVTDTDPPRIDPASEKVIFTWLAGGHNGCDLHFGPDGFLYVSTGDGSGPNPPDGLVVGQDMSSLLSKILRIDVDREANGKAYAIPPDNPFVKTPNARPETWAYGFRNPWRMSFDRQTGDLWVGDVGWEQWEMIYRIQKGGNYGWSVMEGPQQVRTESKRGPTPVLAPTIAFPHTEAASITGGYVYRGKRYKDLVGTYVCGDWVTRKIWGTRFDGDKIIAHKELAVGNERVVAFGEDHDKELYIVSHDEKGTIHQLAPNDVPVNSAKFPRRLSDTGLFASVKEHALAPGVLPFSINAELWADHTSAERFVAVPRVDTIKVYDSQPPWPNNSGEVYFPKDGVLAKTFALEMERGNPLSRRRLETQILHFDGVTWKGYSYAWNDEQTDATLVDAKGMDRTFTIVDVKAPGKKRSQRWHFASRAECMTCHNPWAGFTLAFNVPQLNRNHDYGGVVDNQLRTLAHIDLISFRKRDWKAGTEKSRPMPGERLTDPFDATANLDDRAKAYLHANCSHCHQFGGGGTALIDLRSTTATERAKLLEARPLQGTFEIPSAQLIAPGDPFRSVLYYRMAKSGPGRMPHIGSEIVDERGLRLMHDWIRQIHPRPDERALLDRLRSLDETAALAREKAERSGQLERMAIAIAKRGDRMVPTPEDRKAAAAQLKSQHESQAKTRAAERTAVLGQLLTSTSSGLLLANALQEQQVPDSLRPQVLSAAMALPNSQVRDLFERFVPDELRPKRLGSIIRSEEVLQRKGDAERGRELFFTSAGLQCANCHRIGEKGSTLGPDLSAIGKKYTRAQLLESILEPSKFIDPKYVAYLLETTDGKVQTGLLASKNDKEVVLKMAGDKELRLPASSVAGLFPQPKSLMPELLLRDLTLVQAADLLEFLAGRR